MIKSVNDNLLEELKEKATQSERKRSHHTFHRPEEYVQRMVDFLLKGTYIPPHKHSDPDKVEHFVVIMGKVACINHNEDGSINEIIMLSPNGPNYSVDITPNTYHMFVCVTDEAAMVEVTEGPYNPASHKKFAPFAPGETDPEAPKYLEEIEKAVKLAEERM